MSKNYQELYKRYRPRTWDDIIGQDKIIDTLRQAVITGQVPTGYMFFGPHGCGKTSSAFILAKALNCNHLKEDGNPCNECQTCKSIDKNSQIGIQYISMANRGSAEDVRKIVQEAQLAQPINHQVWILDECHRLSGQAFDALLIPLESEKTKSLFIFCSTEPEKIPKTILSRLQTRTFNPVKPDVLATNLAKIVKNENLEISHEEIIRAVQGAQGSVRDSIRNLETLVSNGVLPEQYSEKVLKLLCTRNPADIFRMTSEMASQGQSFVQTIQRLYSDLAGVFMIQAGAQPTVLYPAMSVVAENINPNVTSKCLDILGQAIDNMSKNTVDSRILFEIALKKCLEFRNMYEKKTEGRQ